MHYYCYMRSTQGKAHRGKAASKPQSKLAKKPTSEARSSSNSAPHTIFPRNILEARQRAADKEIAKVVSDAREKQRREALALDSWQIFLECIRRLPDRGAALETAKLSRKELSDRLRIDPDFEKEFKQAFDDGLDSMEDEVVRRAVLGVDEPVFQGGLLVGHKTKYSDTLLMFFLEASRKKFRSGDAEMRRPLSDEAKSTMREIFQGALDETEDIAPPAEIPAKKRGRPRKDAL